MIAGTEDRKADTKTITALTAESGFGDGVTETPPAADQMIAQIRDRLASQVKALAKACQQAHPDNSRPTLFDIAYPLAVQRLQQFDEVIENIPKGFVLAPVLYSKIKRAENDTVWKEFGSRVQHSFFAFLANDHSEELRALGICERGIKRMKAGRAPVNEDGVPYFMNVDHIIERAGAGQLSTRKEVDPLMPPDSEPTYSVNHFSNLILLSEEAHAYKNFLNELQEVARCRPGDSKWVLMMVPEASLGYSGFVAQQQDPQHPLHGLSLRTKDPSAKIAEIEDTIGQAHSLVEAFRNDAMIAGIIKRNKKTGSFNGKSKYDFNKISAEIGGNEARRIAIEDYLRPSIQHVFWHLRDIFNSSSARKVSPEKQQLRIRFLEQENLEQLRQSFFGLPSIEEAKRLQDYLLKEEQKLKETQAGGGDTAQRAVPVKEKRHMTGAIPR